jgi:hypothetical protein
LLVLSNPVTSTVAVPAVLVILLGLFGIQFVVPALLP